ncbi:MAG TPA: cytochrome c oxidase assembly protein, partial [Chloroflexota bacterium]|nr:cytochrome c oxidase assembly protein [Chloroflexota bacterium]
LLALRGCRLGGRLLDRLPMDRAMTGWQIFLSTWQLQPSVLIGCVALIALYLLLVPQPTMRFTSYLAGVLVLACALLSPLDTLGDRYLFSAHMLQHLLLLLVVPPLLLIGLPLELVDSALAYPRLRWFERVVAQPLVAWPLATVTLLVWHAPALYDAALANEDIHIFQHLSFLFTATLFWWPVLAPLPERRLSLPLCILYLLGASFVNSVLGILITFAPPGLYPAYLHPVGLPAIEHVIRDVWLIDPASDQQIGGLLMWVPGGMAYLFVIAAVFGRWLGEPDDAPDTLLARPQ